MGDAGAQVLVPGSLASVDPATGATTVIGGYGQIITGHDVDTAGTLWGVGFLAGDGPSTFTINTATGVATPVTSITNAENGILAIAIDHPCAVPVVEFQPRFTG